jgi:hypothetical protein
MLFSLWNSAKHNTRPRQQIQWSSELGRAPRRQFSRRQQHLRTLQFIYLSTGYIRIYPRNVLIRTTAFEPTSVQRKAVCWERGPFTTCIHSIIIILLRGSAPSVHFLRSSSAVGSLQIIEGRDKDWQTIDYFVWQSKVVASRGFRLFKLARNTLIGVHEGGKHGVH